MMADNVSTQPAAQAFIQNEGGISLQGSIHNGGSTDPAYAQPELSQSTNNLQPPVTEKVIYTDTKGFHNKQVVVHFAQARSILSCFLFLCRVTSTPSPS